MAVFPNGLTTSPTVTDKFGMRFHPIYKEDRMHWGTDSVGHPGGYNYAPEDGVVVYAGPNGGAGNEIRIRSAGGREWRIKHNANGGILVSVGETVKQGQKVGITGTTGDSTGVHCHLELIINGSYVDAFAWIALNLIAQAAQGGALLTESDNPMFWLRRNLTGEVFLFGNAQGRQHVADPGQLKGLRTLTQTINVPAIPVPSDDPKQVPGVNEDLWGLAIDFFGQPSR